MSSPQREAAMSSFNNMMERIPKEGTRPIVPSPALPPPYVWARTAEMDSGLGLSQRRALRTLRKHWKAGLTFALIVELLLALLVFSLDNTYEARAVIDVEAPGTDAVGIGRDAVSNSANVPAYLDTQTEILNSDGLILRVIDQLHLDQNPIFMKRSWFEKSVVSLAGWLPSNRKSPQQRDVDKLLLIFRRGLTVGQVKGSQLVEVRFESRDPNLSAQIVNSMTEQYLQRTYRSAYDATLRAVASLSPQM